MSTLDIILEVINKACSAEVVWLYGSRARGDETPSSDFDIALALPSYVEEPYELIENARSLLNQNIDESVSLVSINHIPIPLAYNVVDQGVVVHCTSDFRLRLEQQRVWSLWEEYKYHHESNRKSV